MPNFTQENNTGRPAFQDETSGGSNSFVDEEVLPSRTFDLSSTPVQSFLDTVGYIPSSQFEFEDVPGNILDDFTGSVFDDDVYFRFGNDEDFSIGYSSSNDQLAFINANDDILFGIDKQGRLRMRSQGNIPSDSVEDADFAKVGTEYYLRKDDSDDFYNVQ